MARRNDNKVWIALGISVALLGAIIAVNQLYGWDNVYEDVKSMGKSVWFAFEDWVGVRHGNETVIMPEEFAENEAIVDTGGIQDAVEEIPVISRAVDFGLRTLDRITNGTIRATQAIRNVNITVLQEQLSQTVGAGIEFVSVTLETGREVIAPIENATRRALGDAFDEFVSGLRQEFEAFFSEQNLQNIINTIIEIPQSIVMSIRNMLSQLTGGIYTMPSARVENDLDAYTYAGR